MSYLYDHRLLAGEMDIFFFADEIGAGLPIWLPNGVAIRDELERFVRELERKGGYQRVVSPHLAKAELYERSGHLASFKESMFPPLHWPEENQDYYLKPMNCPHHHKVFQSSLRSYRQLPLRIAEYGQVYRYEKSGSLRGLSRVRGLCQNDAHIYIDADCALQEMVEVLKLHELCYRLIGLKGYRYRLSKRNGNNPQAFQGEAGLWIQSEQILRDALISLKLDFFEAEGEAAFYGPKIDVQMVMGQNDGEESIASVQLDFLSGERFDLSYIDPNGHRQRPWIVHRAPLGSHERFIALLLEYFDGQLPGWLAPVQVQLIPVSDKFVPDCRELASKLSDVGLRARVDEGGGSLSKRILVAHQRRPFAKMIVGQKERASGLFKIQFREGDLDLKESALLSEIKARCQAPVG
jgi:threonyl-tRNA synthetase